MSQGKLLVAEHNGVVQIRVIGLADYNISQELQAYGSRMLEKGAKTIVVDLAECKLMDSTFMGVLAYIAQQAKHRASVIIVNSKKHHREAMKALNIDTMFQFSRRKSTDTTWESLCAAAADLHDMKKVADTVLVAHRTLMDASPDNVPLFEDLVRILGEEVSQNHVEKTETNDDPQTA